MKLSKHAVVTTVFISLLNWGSIMAEPLDKQRFSSGVAQVSLVELYTSEGCSSCPPADRWLSNLNKSPLLWDKIVPLAFHVDYWDYLGWKDPFARKLFSRRQYRYKLNHSLDSVYTPGFVVAGQEWRGWFSLFNKDLPENSKQVGNLEILLNSEHQIKATFKPSVETSAVVNENSLDLNVALLGFDLENKVTRGENRGKTLKHDFVVLEYHSKPLVPDNWLLSLSKIEADQKLALAAWVSLSGQPNPLQATGGWLR